MAPLIMCTELFELNSCKFEIISNWGVENVVCFNFAMQTTILGHTNAKND